MEQQYSVSRTGRLLVLSAAFLGWMFAGMEMSLVPLITREATIDLAQLAVASSGQPTAETVSSEQVNTLVGQWFIKYVASFLLGAAFGGLVFGWLGDVVGRAKTMGISILWYSGFTGLSYFIQTPEQLFAMRFVACMGVGGMWPAGVSLVSEAWPNVSRPMLAGLIGTSANVGIMLLGLIASHFSITVESWRWMFLLGAFPALLGFAVLLWVPESPLWLASQRGLASQRELAERGKKTSRSSSTPIAEVFRPPMLWITLIGIALGTVPLLGAWGAQKWIIPWSASVGGQADPQLKGLTQTIWGIGAALGSLSGGWLAAKFGRRLTYLLVSIFSLIISSYIFHFTEPARDWSFLLPVFLLGLIATVYFGWLPLYLPELFPTRVRSTGVGVTFNFGRIISAILILSTMGLIDRVGGDYAKIGQVTSLIYIAGVVVILLSPKTKETIVADD